MNHFDTEPPVFSIKLSQEQKAYVSKILPKGYSLQPTHINNLTLKNSHLKKINIQYREQSLTQKEPQEHKRRKIKTYQNLQQQQKRNTLGKRDQISKMATIIKKLKKHDSSWPFRAPVDPKALLIPNYTEVVINPMDLQTIQQRIKTNKYEHLGQIQRDVNQIFLNSYKFNSKESQYFQATSKLQSYYNFLLSEIQQNLSKKQFTDKNKKKQQISSFSQTNQKQNQNQKSSQVSQFQKELLNLLKKANEVTNETKKKGRQKTMHVSTRNDGPLNIKQRRQLAQQIKSLDQIHLCRIYEIIKQIGRESMSVNSLTSIANDSQVLQSNISINFKTQQKSQILYIDLQKMDNKMLRQLQNYVRLQKNSITHDKQQSIMDSQENNYSVY